MSVELQGALFGIGCAVLFGAIVAAVGYGLLAMIESEEGDE